MNASTKNVKDDVAKKDAGKEAAKEAPADPNVKVKAAFEAALAAGKNEDAIKMDMVKAGCAFKQVAKLYNDYLVVAGVVSSKEDRTKTLDSTLKGLALNDETTFDKAVASLVSSLKGVNEKAAAALIRAWAKKAEVPVFTKPKSEGTGRTSFASQFYGWLVQNPRCTPAQAKAYIQGTDGHAETSNNVKANESHYLGIAALVNRIAGA